MKTLLNFYPKYHPRLSCTMIDVSPHYGIPPPKKFLVMLLLCTIRNTLFSSCHICLTWIISDLHTHSQFHFCFFFKLQAELFLFPFKGLLQMWKMGLYRVFLGGWVRKCYWFLKIRAHNGEFDHLSSNETNNYEELAYQRSRGGIFSENAL